ncbi:hypothetical protein [Streptomyces yaizuensis]|uniref:Uncharacterized protein n=1 Tax=Streptomyces yaizuensis TaxID=2989713 RepID=A0ABQ5NXC7_9ACTN|nr:hypothetical protein [Streptomyces sp. YSPA8]GLF94835.1 hypothetical protein SYYSPA8_11080 [Streptomyces sp. YSPA8]
MRTFTRATKVGESYRLYLSWVQADLMVRALRVLAEQDVPEAVLAVRLLADREDVTGLIDRLTPPDRSPRDVTLTSRELHVIHSALVNLPLSLSTKAGVSEERIHEETTFYRENFEGMALGLLAAVSGAAGS